MAKNFDFLFNSHIYNEVTSENIFDIWFVHGSIKTATVEPNLSFKNLQVAKFKYFDNGKHFSYGKMSGNVLWASPFQPELISYSNYKITRHMNNCFGQSKDTRKWYRGDIDKPIVAISEWDAYTQLAGPCFTAQEFVFFKLIPFANILIINTFAEYQNALTKFGSEFLHIGIPTDSETFDTQYPILNFNNISKQYDGIYINANLQNPNNEIDVKQTKIFHNALRFWDVDSLVIWNDVIADIFKIKASLMRSKTKSFYYGKNKKAFTKGVQLIEILNDKNLLIKENNFIPTTIGIFVGMQIIHSGFTIYYHDHSFCYKVTNLDTDCIKTEYVGCIEHVSDLVKATCTYTSDYEREIEISYNCMVLFKNNNIDLEQPAVTFWIDGILLFVHYLDIVTGNYKTYYDNKLL